jgi:hypothetical protein
MPSAETTTDGDTSGDDVNVNLEALTWYWNWGVVLV